MSCLFSTFFLIYLSLPTSCAPKPPYEKGDFKTSDLVKLLKLDSTIHLDIRYATNNNILEQSVYKEARAFLKRPTAEAIEKVNEELKLLGYVWSTYF